ncbi:DUF397 domain-containing protein [Kibdelosporangium phytohabitans]|uniref:DUF397 domain-containing protein n=1 Tax=Kibdelosporangium phytohabitans TaxID=860235 RepID=UPI0009F8603C|nr:DUF397 domain-containing protein [Kibdelosporangium phytohabitans]MBE1462237.1 hypothetical protein [Kibdelosporangium phytohabitans]
MDELVWRKSSFSGPENNANCVEVARPKPGFAVRDSKRPASGVLTFPATTWQSFCGQLTRP